jgi:hypothetical protein
MIFDVFFVSSLLVATLTGSSAFAGEIKKVDRIIIAAIFLIGKLEFSNLNSSLKIFFKLPQLSP